MRKLFLLATIFFVAFQLASFALAGGKKADKQKMLDPAGIQRLKENSSGKTKISISDATGGARFIGFSVAGLKGLGKAASPQERSAAFFREYGSVFGLKNALAELKLSEEKSDSLGGKHLSYSQSYFGVPVFAGVIKTHFDAAGKLRAVNGNIIPEINVNPRPSRTSDDAAALAMAKIRQDLGPGKSVSVRNTNLYVYRTGLVKGVPGENHLVWEVEVGNGADVREFVYMDAHTGKFVDQITGIIDQLNRRAYDGMNLNAVPASYPASPFWVENDPFPTTGTCVQGAGLPPCNDEADNMIIASEETYNFFAESFGRDSFDGTGGTMDSIFDRGYSCPNASWNGTFISFCPGLTTDDVTAHEWGHAYTQYTHGLIYAWQPGALNESYSDIWGETVDRINNRDNLGNSATDPARAADECSTFGGAPPPTLTITGGSAAGSYQARASVNEPPRPFTVGPTAMAVAVPASACSAVTGVSGKIAIVDWTLTPSGGNECGSGARALNAFNAGATGIIFIAPAAGILNLGSISNIASVQVTRANGLTIIAGLPASATISLGVGTDSSTRWLVGEDDTGALAGPLRDMWNPRCFGNPGKVSDLFEYACAAADQGGVHTNSGIPNHAYALLVDGGTYNGQTIAAIGLTKAAHIYFRAMTVYQNPATDFPDHADAIEQSCSDLIGVNLADLTTGAPSGEIITAANCTQVSNAVAAVELRTPPSACNFQPLLAKNPPADPVCGPLSVQRTLLSNDFEGSITGWTTSTQTSSSTFTPRSWLVNNDLPDEVNGKAFYAPDPTSGSCSPAGDETGVLNLTSPAITLPAAVSSGPVVTFDHWIATEFGFDAGQLMLSVNGGPFSLVTVVPPPNRFIYNGYNIFLATGAQGNTNPRAGQQSWSGTDAGSIDGSWGKSIVNLAGLVSPGSSIQLRWDLSTDGCGGNPVGGWYVDNLNAYDCEPDTDGDGLRDVDDNCPSVANPGQEDFDLDGIGDACDPLTGPPVNKDQCKNNGWKRFDVPRNFKNQGDCIQYVNTGK